MSGVFDSALLEKEVQRMGDAMSRLRPFSGRHSRNESCADPLERSGLYEINLADISVAEFRSRCSWE